MTQPGDVVVIPGAHGYFSNRRHADISLACAMTNLCTAKELGTNDKTRFPILPTPKAVWLYSIRSWVDAEHPVCVRQ